MNNQSCCWHFLKVESEDWVTSLLGNFMKTMNLFKKKYKTYSANNFTTSTYSHTLFSSIKA